MTRTCHMKRTRCVEILNLLTLTFWPYQISIKLQECVVKVLYLVMAGFNGASDTLESHLHRRQCQTGQTLFAILSITVVYL